MSTTPALNPLQVGDVLAEQAALAARAQRRNRPLHLIWAAIAALCLGVLLLGLALLDRVSAARERDATQQREVQIVTLLSSLKALDAQADDPLARAATAPMQNVGTLVSEAGREAGLANPVGVGQMTPPRTRGGLSGRRYTYTNISDPSLTALLRWVQLSLERVPGLEVNRLEIRPQPQHWAATVTFTRWERAQ